MKCTSTRRVTAGLLLSFLTLLPSVSASQQVPLQLSPQAVLSSNEHTFTLRHIFHRGLYRDPDLHKKLDIKPHHEFVSAYDDEEPEPAEPPRFKAKSNPMLIERLADRRHEVIASHLDHSSLTGQPRALGAEHWTLDELPGPDTTDKETVVNLAIMAANSYVPTVGQGEWEDVTQGFNLSTRYGWQGDGLRGYIFADEGNKTVVVSVKGTSPAVFDGDGTTTRDKLNDNLFFSCCCGQGGRFFWRQVCDCSTSTYTCNSTCLLKALHQKTRYYSAALDLYSNITALYPHSNVWLVGHSLGGAVSAMVGLTYGIPTVTFEAPGDDLAARRLGLPVASHKNLFHPYQHRYTGARHFGHTADPIFMGTCNGALSPCTLGGYAMESQCHTGAQCVYDTVGDYGWRVGLGYHRIHDVIDNVIRKYDKVPECVPDSECVDCFNWKYYKSNNSDSRPTTTSTTTAPIVTRTETCKTPGWWGCQDSSTKSSTPVITTTYTTTSCSVVGWFGCNKEVNVTVTTTTAAPTSTSTSTCETPGWFGCQDSTTAISSMSTITTTTTTTKPTTTQTSRESTTCKTPGLFFGCYDETTTTHGRISSHTASKTSEMETTTTVDTTQTTSCENYNIFFGCLDEPTSTTASHSITSQPSTTSDVSSYTSTSTKTHTHTHKHGRKCKVSLFFGLICLG